MQWRDRVLSLAVLGLVCGALAACDEAEGADAAPARPTVRAVPSSRPVAATIGEVMGEADRNALDLARNACAAHDFRGLFTQMAASPAVRRIYSANLIELALYDARGKPLSSVKVAADRYRAFPVRLVDYDYKPVRPVVAGDDGEYLDIQFNQSQSQVYAVDWARVHYDGQSQGGDDHGRMLDRDGQFLPPDTHPAADGQLLFEPVAGCWKLVSDMRWRRS